MSRHSWIQRLFETRTSPIRTHRWPSAKPNLLSLEDRSVPAVTSFAGGVLSIDVNNAIENLVLTNDGTNITVTSDFAVTGAGVTFATGTVNKIAVTDNTGLASQTVTFAGTAYTLAQGLSSTGVEVNTFNADISATGASAISVTAPQNISVAAVLTAGSGGVTLTGQGTPAGNYTGVSISKNVTSTTGAVNVTGKGGNAAAGSQVGVSVSAGAIVSGTATTVTGTGGASTGNSNFGISVTGTNSAITSAGGNVNVTGQGGSGVSDGNYGVDVEVGGKITAGSTGTVIVQGTGGAGTGSSDYGVFLTGTNSSITSAGGNVQVTGQGGGSASFGNSFGVYVLSGGQITAGSAGTVTVQGTGGTSTGNGEYGVFLSGTNSSITSAGGNVQVTGQGGGSGISSGDTGVVVVSGGQITAGSTGTVTVQGTGGAGTGGNAFGVEVNGTNSSITSGGGNVQVTGQGGGSGGSAVDIGVVVLSGAQVTAVSTGTVTVLGTGGASTGGSNRGVQVAGTNSSITSAGGAVQVTGQGGGSGVSGNNIGVFVISGGQITAGSTGTVTVLGTGGAGTGGSNRGVLVTGTNTAITSAGGTVQVTGIEGAGTTSFAIQVDTNAAITTATNGGTVTLIGNSIDFDNTAVISAKSTSSVMLRQRTNTTAIDLGGADAAGILGLTDAELDRLFGATLVVGDANTGNVTVSANISRPTSTIVQLQSGSNILISGGKFDTNGGTLLLTAGGSVQPTNSGVDAIASTVSFASGTKLGINITGATVDTKYTQFKVTGIVDLTGADLALTGAYTFLASDLVTIVNGTSRTGTFNGLADGATLAFGAQSLRINYTATGATLKLSTSLTAALDGSGNLVITDAAGGQDNKLTAIVSGTNVVITDAAEQFASAVPGATLSNGNKTITIPVASITGPQIIFNTAGGNDLLAVDISGGAFSKAIVYNGGAPAIAPGDGLIVRSNGTGTATYTPSATTAGDGVVTTSGGTITFTGLEPIDINGFATASLASLPGPATPLAAGNSFTVVNGFDFFNGGATKAIRVSGTTNAGGTAIETVAFWNNGTVAIDTSGIVGASTDVITITNADGTAAQSNNTNLIINTGIDSAGDSVQINGAVAFAGSVTVTSKAINSTAAGTITTSTGLTVSNTDATSTLNGVLGGAGGLVKLGTGTVSLAGANSFTGTTTISVGTLKAANASALGTTAGGTTVVSGATLDLNGQAIGAEALILNGTGVGGTGALVNTAAGAASYAGQISLASNSLATTAGTSLTLTGQITGANELATNGPGTFIFANATSDFNRLQIFGGQTKVGILNGFGTGTLDVLNSSGNAIDLNGFDAQIDGLRVSGLSGIQNSSATLATITLGANGGTNFYGANVLLSAITGNTNVVVNAGTFSLRSNGSTYGTTKINAAGILNVGGATAAGNLGTGTITNAGMLQFERTDALAIPNVIAGTGTLDQIGAGTTTLTGVAAASQTNVTLGTLLVDTTLTSPVAVSGTGTLGGTGTVIGAVTVTGTGTVSPGPVTAILGTGNLTLNAGTTYSVQLNGTTVGTQYDQLNVTGTVSLGGATLAGSVGFVPALGNAFTVVNNDGVDPVVGQFAQGTSVTINGYSFSINYAGGDGNDVVLTLLNPTTVYVDDSWTGTAAGTDPVNDPVVGGLRFGYNAFATIQNGVVGVAANGTLTVFGGTYAAAVNVNKILNPIRILTNTLIPAETLVSIGGAVALTNSATFSLNAVNNLAEFVANAPSANLTFGSTVDGPGALAVTGTGTSIFAAAVGGTPLASLSTDPGIAAKIAANVSTTGAQTFGGTVVLTGNVVAASSGSGTISFANTVTGAFGLVVNTAGLTAFNGNVNLGSLTVNGPGTTNIGAATIATATTQDYNENVVLTANVSFLGNGNITFGGTLTGGFDAVANTPATTTFASAVNVGSLTTDAGGTTVVAGGSVATATFQQYNDDVTLLNGPTAFSNATGDIRFQQTLAGALGATVNATGLTVFNGNVNLGSLTVNGPGTTNIGAASISTATAQTYNENVVLTANVSFLGNGNIAFGGTLTGSFAAVANTPATTTFVGQVSVGSLTTGLGGPTVFNTGSVSATQFLRFDDPVTTTATIVFAAQNGDVIFNSTLTNAGTAVTVNSPGNTVFAAAVSVGSLTTDAPGATFIGGGSITTKANQQFNDAVTLTNTTLFTSTGGGDIVFSQSLGGNQNVTITTAGTTLFNGPVTLNSLETDAAGKTVVNAANVTVGTTTKFNDVVTVNNATTFTSGGNITFGQTLNGGGSVAVNNGTTTLFQGPVNIGGTLATDAPGTTVVGGGSVITGGVQTFNDGVSATANTTFRGNGGINFNSSLVGAFAIAANTQNTSRFGGLVNVGSLATDAGGTTVVAGGSVTTSSFQQYNDAVTLAAGTTFQSTNSGDISFLQSLGGNQPATIKTAGTTRFDGPVTLSSLETDVPGTTVVNTNAVTVAQTTKFGDTVMLNAATTFASGGQITFGQGLTGGGSATINNGTVTLFQGPVNIGGTLTTDAAGTTVVAGGSLVTGGSQTFNDGVSAAANATFQGNGGIKFNSSLVGQFAIAANSQNDVRFGGDVNVGSLTTDAGGTTTLGTRNVAATDNVSFGDPVRLEVSTGISSANASIAFLKQIVEAVGSTASLATTAGNGNVSFGDTVLLDPTSTLTIESAQNFTLVNGLTAGRLQQNAGSATATLGGPINLSGGLRIASKTIALPGRIAAAQDAILIANGGGVNQPVGGTLKVPTLGLFGVGAFALDQPGNEIRNGFRSTTTGGTVLVAVDGDLTVDAANGGITTDNRDVTLRIGGSFTAVDPREAGKGRYDSPIINLGSGKFVAEAGLGRSATIVFDVEINAALAILGSQAGNNKAADTFRVRPSATTPITSYGSAPLVAPGDTYTPIFDATVEQFSYDGQNGFYKFQGRSKIDFFGIESLLQFSYTGFVVQTGELSDAQNNLQVQYAIRVLSTQAGQVIPGGLNGSAIRENNFVVAPKAVSSAAPTPAPRIAFGDVNNDGVPDLIIANGPGTAPLITVINGRRLNVDAQGNLLPLDQATLEIVTNPALAATNPAVLTQFFAYELSFNGGINVAVGDFDGDGVAEIITGADVGGGGRVRRFVLQPDAGRFPLKAVSTDDFFAYEESYRGGVRVAVGDINRDGVPDLILGAGTDGGPRVRVLSGKAHQTAGAWGNNGQNWSLLADFFAYDPNFRGGIFVDAGDYNGDGYDDIVTAPGVDSSHIRVFSGKFLAPLPADANDRGAEVLANFLAFQANVVSDSLYPVSGPLQIVSGVAFGAPNATNARTVLVSSGRGTKVRVEEYADSKGVATLVTNPQRPTGNLIKDTQVIGDPIDAANLSYGATVAGFVQKPKAT